VPCGDIRQSNCYYSSSDVHFKTRYEADERYPEVIDGKWTLRGGWRVYSSGPGIYIGLIISKLLGIRIEAANVIIDPVLTKEMDGLSASMTFLSKNISFNYSVRKGHFSPKSIRINGKDVTFTLEETRYRKGGAVIPVHLFILSLDREENIMDITI
jgi:cellobiose phosphorylase